MPPLPSLYTSRLALHALFVVLLACAFLTFARASLYVVTGPSDTFNPSEGNYDNGIYLFNEQTGASAGSRGSYYGGVEGWYGLCRGSSGAVFAVANSLGTPILEAWDRAGDLVRTQFPGVAATTPGMIAFGPDGGFYGTGYDSGSSYVRGIFRTDPVTGARSGPLVKAGDGGTTWIEKFAFDGSGNLYVTSDLGIVRFDAATGAFRDLFVPMGSGGLANPTALVVGPDGHLYVTDRAAHSVKRYHGATGAYLGDFVAPAAGGLNTPADLTFGPDGNLFVASYGSRQVLRYAAATGAFLGVAATTAKGPRLIAFDAAPVNETVWFDDALPAGAQPGATGGDAWNWVSTATNGTTTTGPRSDAPRFGTLAHRSNHGTQYLHEHFFNFAEPLAIAPGDTLFAYVYVTGGANEPSQITLNWCDGSNWEHRAYWLTTYAAVPADGGGPALRYMGYLSSGSESVWLRLEIPARSVGLEGKSIMGMSFTLGGGTATWDRVGKFTPPGLVFAAPPEAPTDHVAPTVALLAPGEGTTVSGGVTLTATAGDNVGVASVQFQVDGALVGTPATTAPYSTTWDTLTAANGPHVLQAVAYDAAGNTSTSAAIHVTVQNQAGGTATAWFDDGFPQGAQAGGSNWYWTSRWETPPHTGAAALYSSGQAGMNERYFNFAWNGLTLGAQDSFYIDVYLDPANPPRELVISFCANNWEHRAYWGENLLQYATDGTAAQHRVGNLPAGGQWVRLKVPAAAVDLVGRTVQGLSLTLYNGYVVFDQAGKLTP